MPETARLVKSMSSISYIGNPYGTTVYGPSYPMSFNPARLNGDVETRSVSPYVSNGLEFPTTYRDELHQSRFFYRYDPIASTVINRMADMASSRLRNKRGSCTDEELAYFNALADKLNALIPTCSLEYLISGMVIPDYGINKVMGTKLDPDLGRKRYAVPDPLWVRNPDNIILKRVPTGMSRLVLLRIPEEERTFIMNNGVRADGTEDKELYAILVKNFPEYVAAIKEGKTLIPLTNVQPVLRRALPNCDYPQPFLVPALAPLKHKWRIKQMDYSLATRVIESIRLIKAGNDAYPVTDDDPTLEEIRQQVRSRPNTGENEVIYTLFTNHTVTVEWIYPPMDALLSDSKYDEPNADIFMAMGFSRVLLVGESQRSNSGGSNTTTLGAMAALNEMRARLLEWVTYLYKTFADLNSFRNIPDPTFTPIPSSDIIQLAQIAIQAAGMGALSKNTIAQMFGTDYETEIQQIEQEKEDQLDMELDATQQRQELQQQFTPDPTQQPAGPPSTTPSPPNKDTPAAK